MKESKPWGLLSYKVDPDSDYIYRLRVIKTPRFGVYIHWIGEPDLGKCAHDHTWKFWTFMLSGGYTEELHTHPNARPVTRQWKRWSFHRMPLESAHRIVSVENNTVTLVFAGPKVKSWRFWTEDGRVHWREYLQRRV